MGWLDRYTLREKRCDLCGKSFIPTYEYVYHDKKQGGWFCSWTCFNHRNDKGEETDGRE